MSVIKTFSLIILITFAFFVPSFVSAQKEVDKKLFEVRLNEDFSKIETKKSDSCNFMSNFFFTDYSKGIFNRIDKNNYKSCKQNFCVKKIKDIKVSYKRNDCEERFNISKVNESASGTIKKVSFFISTVGSGSIGRILGHRPVVKLQNNITDETKKFTLSDLKEKRSAKYWHVFNLDLIHNKAAPIKNCCNKKQLNYSLGNGRLVSGFSDIRKSIFLSNIKNKSSSRDVKSVSTSSSKKINDLFLGQSYFYKIIDMFSGAGNWFINIDKNSDIQASKINYKKTDNKYNVGDNFISNWGKALGELLQ